MKHSQKIKYIMEACILVVAVFSLYILYRTIRPSRGVPYEQLSMEQAVRYMNFEQGYVLLDVGNGEDFEREHIPDALNIPVEILVEEAPVYLTNLQQMIYVYSLDVDASREGALRLCHLGYTNITQIEGNYDDWKKAVQKLESEGSLLQIGSLQG